MSDSQALTPAGCCPSEVEQGAPCKQQGEPPLTGKCLTCLACPACQAPQTCDSIDLGAVLLAPTRSVPSAESSALPSSHPPSGLWRPPPPPLWPMYCRVWPAFKHARPVGSDGPDAFERAGDDTRNPQVRV